MRQAIDQLPGSLIRAVADACAGRSDVLAFWFGESDETTPAFVRDAAIESLNAGETFYSSNLGLLALREALSAYIGDLHGPVGVDRIVVTSSGVHALMLAMQLLVDPGDEVAVVVPVWPNLPAQPAILGARVSRIPLHVEHGVWRLDIGRLCTAVTPRTRVLLLNAPGNPTGWTLDRAEQQQILEHCRRTGTWIVADEVYERIHFGAGGARGCAPSFLDIAADDDRLVVVNSFSKVFLMTGWRLGWMVVPVALLPALGKLVEFNTSCAPVFVQRGALAGLARAGEFIPSLVDRLRHCRDTLVPQLAGLHGVTVAPPVGGLYAFFRIAGYDDSLALAKRLVAEAGLGLAPGRAFGSEGEGWLRWCFASRDPMRLTAGVGRLKAFLDLPGADDSLSNL